MSENVLENCAKCFNPFPRYATICPACHYERWIYWFEYIQPHPDTGEFHVNASRRILTHGLRVFEADDLYKSGSPFAPIAPKEKGLVLLIRLTGPDDSWETIEQPRGDNLVKPVGYVWSHTTRIEEHPNDDFPPLSPDEARDKYFYEQGRKPKGEKLADSDILARAKRLHGKGSIQEWYCDFSIQHMRKLRDAYPQTRGLPEIKKRPYTRK
jgi:hypothetical protein